MARIHVLPLLDEPAHFNIAAHYGVRTKKHKLIFYYGLDAPGALNDPAPPEWELFDLENDPHEMNNVYDDPAYATIVTELKTELLRLKKHYGDNDKKYPELMEVRNRAW